MPQTEYGVPCLAEPLPRQHGRQHPFCRFHIFITNIRNGSLPIINRFCSTRTADSLKVVRDIVSRYDVDAIHMDDYFYPYQAAGMPFPDDKSFQKYGLNKGYTNAQRSDWRRENVNTLIRELKR